MVNNVKVVPLGPNPSTCKASFASLESENLLLVVFFPALVPDNVVKAAARDAKESLMTLAKPSLNEILDNY
jgi:hypothetical protein